MRVMITWLSKTVRLHYQTAESVAAIQRAILEARHGFIFHAEPWTEILESRNFIAARFLQSNADILVGIDNDVGVSREAFERMFAAEVDFVGAEPPAPGAGACGLLERHPHGRVRRRGPRWTAGQGGRGASGRWSGSSRASS